MKRTAGLASAGLVAFALMGCSAMNRMTVTAADYNLAVEREGNQLLLLNIVRAVHRSPMYFTEITQLRGNTTLSFGLDTFEAPLGSAPRSQYKPSPVFNFSMNPSYDVAVLGSKDFVRGLLAPVSMRVIEYYWSQGWPKEMLLLLFVERIETQGEKALNNDPGYSEDFVKFREKIRSWLSPDGKTTIQRVTDPVFRNVALDSKIADSVTRMIEAEGANLRFVQRQDAQNPCQSSASDDVAAFADDVRSFDLVHRQDDFVFCVEGYAVPTKAQQRRMKFNLYAKGTPPKVVTVTLRSPEGVLYYLGEVVRAQLGSPKGAQTVTFRACNGAAGEAPLFELSTEPMDNAFVSVQYASKTYSVAAPTPATGTARCTTPRTTEVLALLAQLIAMQRSPEDLPTTQAVKVIGQ